MRSSADLDCKDFEFQEDAQAFFRATSGDPYRLDEDNDGIACEALPRTTGGPATKPATAPPSNAVARNTDLDCRDFATKAEAQRFFDSTAGDPHGLDADKDGRACEANELAAATQTSGTAVPFVDKDCDDFRYQEDAQALLDSIAGDPHGLDGDDDGKACDLLPKRGATGAKELPRTGSSDVWKWLVGIAGLAFVVGGQLIRLGAASGQGFWRRQALR